MFPHIKDAVYSLPMPILRRAIPRLPGTTPFTPEVLSTRVIFIHVPKAAGSSIKTHIYGRRTGGHRRLLEFAAYDAKKTREFFRCAFVRNPWDRLLSAYSYLRQGVGTTSRDNQFAERHLAQHADFSAFVLALRDSSSYRRAVLRYDHFRPQVYWIGMPGLELNFVGRYETLDHDMSRLLARLGIDRVAAERQRASIHPPYQDTYTEATRAVVARLYEGDIARFGYGFS